MNSELQKKGVSRTVGNSCNCSSSHSTYTYTLPCGLDMGIEASLLKFGRSSISFEKHATLRIENPDYAIIGVRRLKWIKFTIKNPNISHLIDEFESSIVQWLEKRSE